MVWTSLGNPKKVTDMTPRQSDEDWTKVGRYVDEHTRVWTSADLARHGIDRRTLDRLRGGEKVRADARRRIALALNLGEDGLDRIARGDTILNLMDDGAEKDRRLSAVEDALAHLRADVSRVLRRLDEEADRQ